MTRDTSRRARAKPLDSRVLRRLAWFRYRLRQFLRFSERETRARGATPQQYVLLLGIAGFTGRGWATVSELAEFLQERHNAVVGLVQRAERRGLVTKDQSSRDRRYVRVRLSRRGMAILQELAELHLEELKRIRLGIDSALMRKPKMIKAADGA
ncbi:MAG TPA: MarR family transcriptional regulator [Terriglobia bacterium]|nr:MarR family transcriptional regulator [Terriglobia bacterium]